MASGRSHGTHFKGPVLGDGRAWAGAGLDLPIQGLSLDDYSLYINDFLSPRDFNNTLLARLDADGGITNTDYEARHSEFTITQISGGGSAALVAAVDTGALRLDCPADGDGPIVQLGLNSQVPATRLSPTASSATAVASEAVVAARFRLLDAGASSFFVGLAEDTSTSAVLATGGGVTSDTHAGFTQSDPDTAAGGAINLTAAGSDDTNSATESVPFSIADSEWLDVAVRVTGTTVAEFYTRRADLVGTPARPKPWNKVGSIDLANDPSTSDAWDADMFPTIALVGSGTGDDLDLDKLVFAVKRDLTIG